MAIRVRGTRSFQVRVKPFPDQTLPTLEAAKQVELQLKLKKSMGDLYREQPTLFGDELDGHHARKLASPDLAAKSVLFWADSKRPWGPLRDVPMPQLRRAMVEDHITRRAAKAPTAARNELQFAKGACKAALSRGQQVDVGIFDIKPPKLRAKRGKALTWPEVQRLAANHPERLRRMILLCGTIGFRWAEATRLDDSMVDLEAAVVTIPWWLNKSRREKPIPLADYEVLLLREQMQERVRGPLLFPTLGGTAYSYSGFQSVWTTAKTRAGLEGFKFHWLRHSAISLMAAQGMKAEVAAERVGHCDGGALILKTYRHLFSSELRDAVALVDAMVAKSGQEVVNAA